MGRAGSVGRWRRRWLGIAVVAVVCVGGVGGSLAVAAAVQRTPDQHAAQAIDRYAADVSEGVVHESGRYRDTITDLAASIGAQSELTETDFAQITSRLNRLRLPGVSSAVFVVPAFDREVASVQAYWRARGATGLRLTPAGTGIEHMFAIFSRPLDGVPSSTGRDLSQASEPAEVLRLARQNGDVAASRTYVLLKDRNLPTSRQQLSFLLTAPVYGAASGPDAGRFLGWVVLGMRAGDFITETLRIRAQGAVTIGLFDVSDGVPKTVATSAPATGGDGVLVRERTVAVAQRQWLLRVQSTDALLTSTDQHLPALSLGIGLLITLLVGILVAILVGTRNRAMAKVDQATAALLVDIEQRKEVEARLRERESELRYLAFHDALTDLANRKLFYDRVEHAIETHRRTGTMLAVLYIDLDGFKQINDRQGHTAGDAVLIDVATRLRGCVRASDTVARLGGDEFAVLAEHIRAPEHARIVASHIVQALHGTGKAAGDPTAVSASVGVVLHRPGHTTTEDILRRADAAMYAAKSAGKNRYRVVHTGHIMEPAVERPLAIAL